MKLTNTAKLVKKILEEFPKTRDDDYLLWLTAIKQVIRERGLPDISKITFEEFIGAAKYSQLPHFETVSRARRKLQESYPSLRATKETQEARAELEEDYKEFARQDELL